MKRILFVISLLFMVNCQDNPDLKRLYGYQYQQDSSFDNSDVDEIMESQYNILDESQLNDSINWSKMKLVDSVFLQKNACQIYMYRYDSENGGDYLCYTTKDSIKLIIYGAIKIDTELVYIIKDYEFKRIINELIKTKKFVLNQVNENKNPPWLE